jgi:hypothetical protein
MRARLGLTLCLSCGTPACASDDSLAPGDDGSTATVADAGDETSTGSDNDLPTMEAVVDAAVACSPGEALALQLVATRIGCVKPPPSPCTLPDPPTRYLGTLVECPANETALPLRVGVEQTGRYHVESVLSLEGGTEIRECYREGDELEVIIDDGRLANRPTITVTPAGEPCP